MATDLARRLRIPSPIVARLVLGVLGILFFVVIVRTAWVSDDAFITFRTIDNFIHGFGLRWNVAERVQSYTHPLWLFVLTPLVALTGNPYLSSLGLSAALTLCTVVLVIVGLRTAPWRACLAVTALLLSKAFTDFSTSGLENPLSHVLLALLMLLTMTPAMSRRRAGGVGLVVGLIGVTRLDLLVLAGPIGLAALRRWRRTLAPFVLGLAPIAAWEIFSVIYYGVPFPNTAYAKLGTGALPGDLLRQGAAYFLDSLNRDPVTLFVILAAAAAVLAAGRGARVPALAVLGYLVYVFAIGGDFMSGRFFSAPLLVSACLLGRVELAGGWTDRLAPLAAVVAFGLAPPHPTVLCGSSYSTPAAEALSPSGITDERGYYFQHSGWLSAAGPRSWPDEAGHLPGPVEGAKTGHQPAVMYGAIGMAGYFAGPGLQIVDPMALADPLLARLPARPAWRIGHYARLLPDGYFESVVEDRNLIQDPHIASLYRSSPRSHPRSDLVRDALAGDCGAQHGAHRWMARTPLRFPLVDLGRER